MHALGHPNPDHWVSIFPCALISASHNVLLTWPMFIDTPRERGDSTVLGNSKWCQVSLMVCLDIKKKWEKKKIKIKENKK